MYDEIAEVCRDKICDLQQKRMDEEFHITANTARQLVKEYVREAIEEGISLYKEKQEAYS